MKNIHNQNLAELAHYIILIVYYRQGLGTCFGDTGILAQHLFVFFFTFEAIASPLNLESSWQPRYSTTVSYCLMEWPGKDINFP